jgi:hypothetical protein
MSGIVPLRRSAIRRPLPSTGSCGSVPRLRRYFGAFRLPAAHSAALRHPSLGGTALCARLSLPSATERSRRRPGALCKPAAPRAGSTRGDSRASQVPGEPHCGHALLFDPGGTSAPGHFGASVLPSAFRDNVGSHNVHSSGAQSHGLPTRCLRFVIAVTCDHARLASRLLASFAGRDWLPAGFLRKVSELVTSHPPCPGFACRTTESVPEPVS